MKITGEKLFNVLILLVVLYFVVGALDFTPKARLLPLVMGLPALALMLWQVLGDYIRPSKSTAEPLDEDGIRRQYIMFASLVAGLALILVFGISLGVALYLFLFLRFISRMGWMFSAVMGFFGFAVTYGLFGQVLHYAMFRGLLDII